MTALSESAPEVTAVARVTILDTQTGRVAEQNHHFPASFWAGMTDFGRAISNFGQVTNVSGRRRFLIVSCDEPGYTLGELNAGYPPELLERHLAGGKLPSG